MNDRVDLVTCTACYGMFDRLLTDGKCPYCSIAQLEDELRSLKERKPSYGAVVQALTIAEVENEMLVDALEHCGYDPEDCIDCGGPPHNEYCRFWKLRHILSFFETEGNKTGFFCPKCGNVYPENEMLCLTCNPIKSKR